MKIGSIVLCAGASKRMKSDKSKMLQDLSGYPLSFFAVRHAVELSDCAPVVVVGHQSDLVKESLNNLLPNLIFAHQKQQNGTASAVQVGLEKLPKSCDTVLVLYGDTPLLQKSSLQELINLHVSNNSSVTLLSSIANNPYGYGRIVRDEKGFITSIVEEKEATFYEKKINEINSGIYVFNVSWLTKQLSNLNSSNEEYYLTDVVKKAFLAGDTIGNNLSPYEEIQGVNDFLQLSQARLSMNNHIINKHLSNGVDIIDINNTYIHESVNIAANSIIYPGVQLLGNTVIGANCVIEAGCIIKNSIIHEQNHIKPYCVLDEVVIEKSCSIGPFAHLRPQTHLASLVKIGNFVEVKKSFINKASKANHLAYIGDAHIGENCNIGAGAITCNYDGQNKHETHIKNNVFIGSNATLIAPIVIKENSYVAASSCITDDVDKDCLAIARSRQINKLRK